MAVETHEWEIYQGLGNQETIPAESRVYIEILRLSHGQLSKDRKRPFQVKAGVTHQKAIKQGERINSDFDRLLRDEALELNWNNLIHYLISYVKVLAFTKGK